MPNFKVYYPKRSTFRSNPNITRSMIGNEYVHVRDVEAETLDQVYYQMQGEIWNADGSSNNMLRKKGLDHSSMSVGDIIVNPDTNQYFEVAGTGFKEF